MKRRPKPNEMDIAAFRDRVKALEEKYPKNLIFNMDETNFHLVNMKHLTWAVTGSDSVSCYNQNDMKSSVTVIATVDREGGKHPLMLVGKGKGQRSLTKYGNLVASGEVWATVSESGWTRESVMKDYLKRLSEYVGKRPCALLLDVYSAHRTQTIKELAQSLNIELVFIPPGCTDVCQPLDVAVFAVLKGYARAKWRKLYHEHGEERMSWETLTEHLVESWQEIRTSTILKGWQQYIWHGIDVLSDDEDEDHDNSGLFSIDESVLEVSSSDWELDPEELE